MNDIGEVMENDDVDIVVVSKEGGGGPLGESGLKFNQDFFCGYSPERINPGDKVNTLTKIKKITSGSTPKIAGEIDRLYKKIITANRSHLDLTNQQSVLRFLKKKKPNFIFIAAAKVGGIYANNKFKADFIYSNLSIQNNLIHAAFKCKIKNLIFRLARIGEC